MWSSGTVCVAGMCAGSVLTASDVCNGTGSCVDNGTQDCAPYACTVSGCPTTCTAHAECQASHYCDASSGQCALDLAQGAICTESEQCPNGFCVDGVCCDGPCDSLCQRCDGSLTSTGSGVCGEIEVGDPDAECSGQRVCCYGSCEFPASCPL